MIYKIFNRIIRIPQHISYWKSTYLRIVMLCYGNIALKDLIDESILFKFPIRLQIKFSIHV